MPPFSSALFLTRDTDAAAPAAPPLAVDVMDADVAACEVCERGMRFGSPWRFEVGVRLEIVFALDAAEFPSESEALCRERVARLEMEAWVVECVEEEGAVGEEKVFGETPGEGPKGKFYQTTLVFLEATQEFRAALPGITRRLTAKRERALEEPYTPHCFAHCR